MKLIVPPVCGSRSSMAAKSQSRQKELRKQSRPTDYGAQATKHRQQSAVLLSRHADREQER
eukprot:1747181-Prymnesium_polylepis.1